MYKEVPNLFSAPFFKKHKIKPYPIDPATMDLDSTFIAELMDLIRNYDKTKPIIIARSDDERLDGYPIDGRCRLYCMAKNLERGIPLPSPFPVAQIEVKDANELRALIAEYENKNRSKGAKFSKAWVEQNLKAIIMDNIEVKGADIIPYVKSLGFSNEAVLCRLVDDYNGEPKSKKAKTKRQTGGLPESLAASWSADSSVYAEKDEQLDVTVSYHSCPDCKSHLKITTDANGRVLKVESAAPTIKKR
jgi:hypothetical protein